MTRTMLADLSVLWPYAILSGGAVMVFLVTFFLPTRGNAWALKLLTIGFAVWAYASLMNTELGTFAFGGLLVHDALGVAFARVILILLILVVPVFPSHNDTLTETAGHVFGFFLLSACGALFMVFANDLLVFFVGLEILSLPLYVLTAMSRDKKKSSEAAFKYFLLGAISSALLMYGAAFLFGVAGTLKISEMSVALASSASIYPGIVAIGSTLVLASVIFKFGLVPFQMWVPDVYEGAPAYVVAWMSGTTKAAVAAFGLRLLGDVFTPSILDWSPVLSVIALASMLWGSFAALHQTNIKRMLGYSSIAHAGYATIAIICAHDGAKEAATSALAFYLLTYGMASLVCFAVLSLEEAQHKTSISDFAGLAKRRPGLALIFSVALLSLAGIPPLAGFFGKFNVFILAVQKEYPGLVIVGVLTSLVSLGYYLRIIVAMYMEEGVIVPALSVRFGVRAALVVMVILIFVLGIAPHLALDLFKQVKLLTLR